MNQRELQKSLVNVRAELERLKFRDAEAGRELELLIAGIEAQAGLDRPAAQDQLRENLSTAITRFEVEHPALTASLGQLVSALSSMGI